MGNLEELGLNTIDNILIIDKNFTIIYSVRFNKRFEKENFYNCSDDFLNMNLFEVYPNLIKADSSIVQAYNTAKVIVKKNQKFKDFQGRVYCTNNISIPIIKQGQVVGVVELTKDITNVNSITTELENSQKQKFIHDHNIDKITFKDILSNNTIMKKNIELAKILSNLSNPTLIYGETGTGKEVFVQAMINYSGINRKKVVIQNCASVPENLMEGMLFGTVKGTYTGAETKDGLLDAADGGILFLDEINSLSNSMQGKLLRVLQDGSFMPIGSNTQKKVSVKVIAAMNVDPVEAMSNNSFRKDLFYRFTSSLIKLLPLRERKEDIPIYIEHYIKEFNIVYNKNIKLIHPDLKKILMDYSWEGNVRELKHIIEMMISTSNDSILNQSHLPAYMYDNIPDINIDKNDNSTLITKVDAFEKQLIIEALSSSNGKLIEASKLLGIPRQTLHYKIIKHNIEN